MELVYVTAVFTALLVALALTQYLSISYLLRRIQGQDAELREVNRRFGLLRDAALHTGQGTLHLVRERIAELEGKPWP